MRLLTYHHEISTHEAFHIAPLGIMLRATLFPEANMQHKRILIVDDETVIAEELAEFLESFDYVCATAFSVDEAEDAVESNPDITLIMTDMRMPGGNGAELITSLKSRPDRQFEYVMISGHLDADQSLEDIKGDDLILMRKPIDINALLAYLENLSFANGFSG